MLTILSEHFLSAQLYMFITKSFILINCKMIHMHKYFKSEKVKLL